MELYETEEQQVAAVKKWFKENGLSLVAGIVIGLSSIVGWKYYQSEQQSHSTQASDRYIILVNQLGAGKDGNDIELQADQLASNFSDTPYAALASLALAKHHYENGKVDLAISKLSWASKNAVDTETQHVAATRLIRVYISEGMYDEANALLNKPHPESFDIIYAELKGDLLVAKNELADARIAYDKAIALSVDNVNRWLQEKRQQLGD